jgi:excisionase family DNA binding protein
LYTQASAEHEFLTVTEAAAALLGVTHKTIHRRIARGDIPATQLGGPGSHIRIPRAAFDHWLWSAGTETADAEG